MAWQFSDEIVAAQLQYAANRLDSAATPGKLWLYGGIKPARGATVTTETLRSVHLLSKPCGTVSGLSLFFSAIGSAQVQLDPALTEDDLLDVTWARLTDGNGVFIADGAAGIENPALAADDPAQPDFKLSRATVLAGGIFDIPSLSITYPAD
jgi:hypothetical protein